MIFLFLVIALESCIVSESFIGLNPSYKDMTLKKTAAIPVFFIPDPTLDLEIDPSLVTALDIQFFIQRTIVESFKKQSNVQGISFTQVNKILERRNKTQILKDIFQYYNLRIKQVLRHKLSAKFYKCYIAKDFISFYADCLASQDSKWKDLVWGLSQELRNADSLLLPIVSQLTTQNQDDKKALHFQLNVLLVSSKNSEIIWAKQKSLVLEGNDVSMQDFSNAFSKSLSDAFWDDFPGREKLK